ncbi:hypothetical protein PCASD_17270 [Puccinia coronata f. sp. avenae]|uniref:Uncharacterized protein n=1 Tax=Puccinia coronata f. sp. avenae TaxID=200324 RepID=A0A2N5U985_9BASI|nr:hypothetical protein PCASD_17270 [Puccinia coronata f. sp. avenae]
MKTDVVTPNDPKPVGHNLFDHRSEQVARPVHAGSVDRAPVPLKLGDRITHHMLLCRAFTPALVVSGSRLIVISEAPGANSSITMISSSHPGGAKGVLHPCLPAGEAF